MKDVVYVDTSIIIEFLNTGEGLLPIAYERYQMWIPATSLIDIFASKTFKDEKLEKDVIQFFKKYFSVTDVDREKSLVASKIVRDFKVTFSKACLWASAITEDIELLVDTLEDEIKAKEAGVKAIRLLQTGL
ncbi:hypothetical protein D6810_02505 [Candidatus Dojkabacteria bacterium]|uniref:PIN domain-containing protein n=1 Tax=Candidatus Dojkabacteria bacterium TaxID=2099670 RepID=A0A3M0YXU9_9BACT|nr:MAG: hypothetical protein D6810_02505 [Candidatus Dojkabacteria bacterium]